MRSPSPSLPQRRCVPGLSVGRDGTQHQARAPRAAMLARLTAAWASRACCRRRYCASLTPTTSETLLLDGRKHDASMTRKARQVRGSVPTPGRHWFGTLASSKSCPSIRSPSNSLRLEEWFCLRHAEPVAWRIMSGSVARHSNSRADFRLPLQQRSCNAPGDVVGHPNFAPVTGRPVSGS